MENNYSFGRDSYVYDYECGFGVKMSNYIPIAPEQEQNDVVGVENIMSPKPIFDNPNYI